MISNGRLNELEKLRQLALDGHLTKDILDEVLPAIYAYKSKVEEMQKALEWYADPKNYRHVESAAYSDVALDEGETARDALKGVNQ